MSATETPVNNGVNVEALLGAREALVANHVVIRSSAPATSRVRGIGSDARISKFDFMLSG